MQKVLFLSFGYYIESILKAQNRTELYVWVLVSFRLYSLWNIREKFHAVPRFPVSMLDIVNRNCAVVFYYFIFYDLVHA